MNCSQCGTNLAADAKFCHKCGHAAASDLSPSPTPSIFPASAPVVETAPLAPTQAAKPKRIDWFSLTICLIILIPAYAAELIPAFAGQSSNPKNGAGLLLGSVIMFYFLFKALGRKPWVGAVVGVIAAFALSFASGFISANARNSIEYVIANNPVYVALKKYDPQAFEQLRNELMTVSKSKNVGADEVGSLVMAKIVPLTGKAIAVTSDSALFQYGQARLRSLEEVAKDSADDCMIVISGALATAGPATRKRILSYTSKESNEALISAMVKVLEDSAGEPQQPQAKDESRFESLFVQIDTVLKSKYGTSANYYSDDSLRQPATERCRSGLLTLKEVLKLPDADRSLMLRNLFG